mgnify:FL=1
MLRRQEKLQDKLYYVCFMAWQGFIIVYNYVVVVAYS